METKNQSENKVEKMVYQCPMRCETDKVYDHPGNCPVCNMKLMPVDGKSSTGHHGHCC